MKRTPPAMLACLVFWSVSGHAQEIPSDYQEVLKSLDRKGDFKDGVLKVNIPRNDLKMTVQGISTPTPFGFGGWVAFTKTTDGNEVMMGDLVLLQDEVNPVMSALLDNGIDVTALHNHFLWDDPHVFYMHVHGMGKAADLARRVKPAFDLIGHLKPPAVTPTNPGGVAIDTAKIAQASGGIVIWRMQKAAGCGRGVFRREWRRRICIFYILLGTSYVGAASEDRPNLRAL